MVTSGEAGGRNGDDGEEACEGDWRDPPLIRKLVLVLGAIDIRALVHARRRSRETAAHTRIDTEREAFIHMHM